VAGLRHGGDALFWDPAGIRPAYFFIDDEVVVVASERQLFKQYLMS
jgi:amidophosphoribosyltransferase